MVAWLIFTARHHVITYMPSSCACACVRHTLVLYQNS